MIYRKNTLYSTQYNPEQYKNDYIKMCEDLDEEYNDNYFFKFSKQHQDAKLQKLEEQFNNIQHNSIALVKIDISTGTPRPIEKLIDILHSDYYETTVYLKGGCLHVDFYHDLPILHMKVVQLNTKGLNIYKTGKTDLQDIFRNKHYIKGVRL